MFKKQVSMGLNISHLRNGWAEHFTNHIRGGAPHLAKLLCK